MINNHIFKPQFKINNGETIEIEGKYYENLRLLESQGTQTYNRIGNLKGNQKEEIIIKEYYDIRQEEIEILQQIRRQQNEKQSKCQNIIKILGIKDNTINQQSQQERKFYVAMEKGKADVLALIIQHKNLPYIIKLNLFLQMVQGVKELHELGYFHRDVKPENFVYFQNQNQEYQIKLIDFGIAKQTDAINQTVHVGTYRYMAPEVLRNEGNYDKSVDVWSLGITFYYILTLEDFIQANNNKALQKYFLELTQQQIDQKLNNSNGIEQFEKQLLACMLQQNKLYRIGLQELINKIKIRIKTFQQENSPKKEQISQQNFQFQKFQQFDKLNFCPFQTNKKNQTYFQIKSKQQDDNELEKLPKLQAQSIELDDKKKSELSILNTQLQAIFEQFQKDIRQIKIECESNEFLSKMKDKTDQLQDIFKEQKKTLQVYSQAVCENDRLFKEHIMVIEKKKGSGKIQLKDLFIKQQKNSQKVGGELELLINSVDEKLKEIKFIPMFTKLIDTYLDIKKQDLELDKEINQINTIMSNQQLDPSQYNQFKEQIQKLISKLHELNQKIPQDNEIQEFNNKFKFNFESYYVLYALVNYIKQFHITKYYEKIRVSRQKKIQKQPKQSICQKQFYEKQTNKSEHDIILEKEAQDLLQRYKNILFQDQKIMTIQEMEKDQEYMDKIIVDLETSIRESVRVTLGGFVKTQEIIQKVINGGGVYKIQNFAQILIFQAIYIY
ncbi:unnamed protein product [Paramecium octaurelia]|uniref:Protein kinase domain-containing protein n=1 Tax=Paramecium octaurelia TaxID=43137 RepID=A0A8S1X7P8_PAROT|nr:unnamed protein product [Paramecium octaurelia]